MIFATLPNFFKKILCCHQVFQNSSVEKENRRKEAAKENLMDGMMEVVGMAQDMQEQNLQMQQAALGAGLAKQAMEFQGSMVNAIISGGDQGMDMIRNAGLAAQGIGAKLNISA